MASRNASVYCIELKLDRNSSVELYGISYVVPALCVVGAIGNALNFLVLRDKHLKTPTYTYLAFLAIAQLVALLTQACYMVSLMHFNRVETATMLNVYLLWPVYNCATTLSLVLTVTYTIDRYFYVRSYHTSSQASLLRHRAVIISVVVCVVAALFNSPRMAVMKQRSDMPSCQAYRYTMATDVWFGIYSTIRFILFNIGSIVLLAVFNWLLVALVARSRRLSTVTGAAIVDKAAKRHFVQQRSLTITLVTATLVALIAEVYATLFNPITEILLWNRFNIISPETMRNMRLFTFPSLLIEYSSNFGIYFLMNNNFRQVLFAKFSVRTFSLANQSSESKKIDEELTQSPELQAKSSTKYPALLIVSMPSANGLSRGDKKH